MEKSRLFQMLYYLLEKRKTTATELSAVLEVSKRTIYRDIDTLSSAGIPIYTNIGRSGGISLSEDFVVDKSIFTNQEMKDLHSAMEMLTASKYYNLESVTQKLKGTLKVDEDRWLNVDFTSWGADDTFEQNKFQSIKTAILNKHTIVFHYMGPKGYTIRTVDPYFILYKGANWYIKGYCHTRKAFRYFRFSRIFELEELKTTFHKIKETKEENEPIEELVSCEFLFPMHVAYRVYDIFSCLEIKQEKDRVRVITKLPPGEWLYSFLMSMGEDVEIVEPTWIHSELITRHKIAIKRLKGVHDEH